MPRFPISINYPHDLDRPAADVMIPQGSVADRRERSVIQARLQDTRLRTYVGNNPEPKECSHWNALLLGSDGRTVAGRWEFDVRRSLCYSVGIFGEPSICASAVSTTPPVVPSVGYFLSDDNRQLVLRVFTATANGDPFDTYFHWQALIPFQEELI